MTPMCMYKPNMHRTPRLLLQIACLVLATYYVLHPWIRNEEVRDLLAGCGRLLSFPVCGLAARKTAAGPASPSLKGMPVPL